MKKIGQFFLCLVPMAGFLAVQIVVTLVVEIVWMVKNVASLAVTGADAATMTEELVMGMMTDTSALLTITLISQIVGFIIAVLIYRFAFKMKKTEKITAAFGPASIIYIIVLMTAFELVISCLMTKAYDWIPGIMDDYAALMEQAGLGELSLLSSLATLVMAPLGEEIVFRGMTLNLAGRLTKKFWIANIIQAFCFGLAHMNIVQGTYAFIMGLILGYIYKRYNSIIATIIAHLAFNFSGTWLVALLFSDENMSEATLYLILAIASVVALAAFISICQDKKTKERAQMYMERVHIRPHAIAAQAQAVVYGQMPQGYVDPNMAQMMQNGQYAQQMQYAGQVQGQNAGIDQTGQNAQFAQYQQYAQGVAVPSSQVQASGVAPVEDVLVTPVAEQEVVPTETQIEAEVKVETESQIVNDSVSE